MYISLQLDIHHVRELTYVASLVNQTLWSQGAYQLEIISGHSERVW